MKYRNFFLYFIIHIVLLLNFAISSNATSNKKKMNLSNNSLTRLLNYLDGDFYSVEKNNRIFNVTGIYFVVSDDGRYSVISYCNETSINCDLNLEEYKAIYRCKKMSKQNCSTLLMEKEITLGDKKDISKEDVNKYFLLNDNSPLSKVFFSDMQIETYKEKYSSNSFD